MDPVFRKRSKKNSPRSILARNPTLMSELIVLNSKL
jgi:hypothetical protein